MTLKSARDNLFLRSALKLAGRGRGLTSPNPLVGAVLVKRGQIIGCGWHHYAGGPHAEIEALRDAGRQGHSPRGASLYVTLEPCCTQGRTPPCTKAIVAAGIRRAVIGATDPNPAHAGRAFDLLQRAKVRVDHGVLADECAQINESFNHWIVRRTPFVTVKAAMTLDGKIATASGESKWITGEKARAYGMKLRQKADAILVGVNTILADNPSLTPRLMTLGKSKVQPPTSNQQRPQLRRIILDSRARTPLSAKVITDEFRALTTVVVCKSAPKRRVAALKKSVRVLVAPERGRKIQLPWLLKKLGEEEVTSLLIEGGGEINASFLLGGQAQRIAFFYAPKILGGRNARKGVAGIGAERLQDVLNLQGLKWHRLGPDLLLTARTK